MYKSISYPVGFVLVAYKLPVAPVSQLATVTPFGDSNLCEVTRSEFFVHIVLNSGERLCFMCAEFDFTVDEGKGPLNPSLKVRRALQKKDGVVKRNQNWSSSCVDLPSA